MINIVLSAVGMILAGIWIGILLTDKKRYQSIIEEVDGNEYFMKELFFVGFRLIGWLQMDMSSPSLQKKAHKLSEMYGSREAKKLVLTDLAAQLSYMMTFAPVGILLSVIMNESLCLIITLILLAFLIIYVEYDKNDKLQKRHEQILREFPHVLSQMALLVNAGMPLREALQMAAQKETGVLSREMKILSDDMANGIPEYEALGSFAERCGVDSVRKLSSLITQNVRKGSSELAAALMELSNEVWRGRVSSVKEEGEKASAKLMVPILIIFIGILIMVAVPMFRNMNF
jgi:tight adherence protein C